MGIVTPTTPEVPPTIGVISGSMEVLAVSPS